MSECIEEGLGGALRLRLSSLLLLGEKLLASLHDTAEEVFLLFHY